MDELPQLSRLLNQSTRLTREYLVLFEKYLTGDHQPSSYLDLQEQLQALYMAKKSRGLSDEWGLDNPSFWIDSEA